jgi:hypothetical protein
VDRYLPSYRAGDGDEPFVAAWDARMQAGTMAAARILHLFA